jgi:hypothetical protein
MNLMTEFASLTQDHETKSQHTHVSSVLGERWQAVTPRFESIPIWGNWKRRENPPRCE